MEYLKKCNAFINFFIYIQFGRFEKGSSNIFTNSETVLRISDKCKVLFKVQINLKSDLEKMERTCLKDFLQLLMIYSLPHQLFMSIFKEKTEPCFVVVIFFWNVFDPFQPNVSLMEKLSFSITGVLI